MVAKFLSIKTKKEIAIIKEGIRKIEKAFVVVKKILRKSVIKNRKIFYKKKILTSEFFKGEIENLFLTEGIVNEKGIIISSGEQTAIPHHPGKGLIKPYKPIVCDIFPKGRVTGYFGDITRTFIKGKPSFELRKMYKAVMKAQKEGIKIIKPGIKAREIYKTCANSLLNSGYDVGDKGFIHGAGHGIGLKIHEEPFLKQKSSAKLIAGNVITVEPGLYYPKIGGIRIEDVVCVTKNGCEILSSYSKEWVIK
ncbi:MAG: Xaa-Pro peptidase family protein [Patescibacteria group bacterium]